MLEQIKKKQKMIHRVADEWKWRRRHLTSLRDTNELLWTNAYLISPPSTLERGVARTNGERLSVFLRTGEER